MSNENVFGYIAGVPLSRNIRLLDNEIQTIQNLMVERFRYYGDAGYCYEIASDMRKTLGVGEVATFSLNGISLVRAEKEGINRYNQPEFIIPYVANHYRGVTSWIYHTVFIYKGYVFTMEIPVPIELKAYRKMLNNLNGCTVKMRNEKTSMI